MAIQLQPTFSPELLQMARWLAGDFSNQEQAWENPPFFASIRVGLSPLASRCVGRDRLLCGAGLQRPSGGALSSGGGGAYPSRDGIVIRNYRPLEPQRWRGCARERAGQLSQLSPADLAYLPGCDVHVKRQGSHFVGTTEPGCRCWVVRNGQTTYLQTTLQLSESEFCSHDRGMDPVTHRQVWGALAGPFRFRKVVDWQRELLQ
jgi:hypothetical protein